MHELRFEAGWWSLAPHDIKIKLDELTTERIGPHNILLPFYYR